MPHDPTSTRHDTTDPIDSTPPKPKRPPSSLTTVLTKDKDCKHSIRYSSADPDAPVTSVYLMRRSFSPMPQAITLIISPTA